MNRISTSILAIALMGAAPIAAEVVPETSIPNPYTPNALVSAAYNGRLEGIPSFAVLESDVAEDNIQPEDLIEVAIAQGRLTPAHLNDSSYINAVDVVLRNIVGDDN